MASLNKQQKRAKRAKIKAKQINIHGRKPAALDDDLDDDLGEIGEPIPEYTLAMFSKMRDAEPASRHDMLMILLNNLSEIINDHPELLDMENADNEAMAATHLAADMLIDYRMWADGMDRDAAQAWLTDPQFITDFGDALDSYRQSLDAQEEKAE
ncbi:hypothetical protein NYP20_01620 [Pseudomonas sp. N3-W]|jgi:hypothetical protein|uniref:hypothetical protein n=1 Tax=Pseudomonas sp. N3-W TaxID=2975049 RepID=UPI00217DD546|nr:hypothetical protein [Pseudomonas sp. N3-W]UWF49689.1 hypothetical protein NYP20_01620 [Pseudomonas sp. N3-W]